jgi:hypothetical protein
MSSLKIAQSIVSVPQANKTHVQELCKWCCKREGTLCSCELMERTRWTFHYFFYNKSLKRVLFFSGAAKRKGMDFDSENEDFEMESMADSDG